MVKVVKSVAAAGAFTCLLLALSACTQDSGAKSATDTTEQDKTLRIAAAANLSDVLPSIVDSYQADNSVSEQDALDIDVTYASSGKLYAQIRAGAPYDIFLSANQEFPARLADESIANKASESVHPFTYTRGQLALYSVTEPLSNITPISLSEVFNSANFASSGKIAIANPNLAPYGAAAKVYLQSQSMYDTLSAQKRLIQAENIGQSFQYAHTGNVDYGFVAQSQLIAIQAKPEQFVTLPPAAYPPILQDGIIINNTASTVAFMSYLRSEVGQQHFSQAGYLPIQ